MYLEPLLLVTYLFGCLCGWLFVRCFRSSARVTISPSLLGPGEFPGLLHGKPNSPHRRRAGRLDGPRWDSTMDWYDQCSVDCGVSMLGHSAIHSSLSFSAYGYLQRSSAPLADCSACRRPRWWKRADGSRDHPGCLDVASGSTLLQFGRCRSISGRRKC